MIDKYDILYHNDYEVIMMHKLAENIKYYRGLHNFSQEDLADKLHISRQAISNCTVGVQGRSEESANQI